MKRLPLFCILLCTIFYLQSYSFFDNSLEVAVKSSFDEPDLFDELSFDELNDDLTFGSSSSKVCPTPDQTAAFILALEAVGAIRLLEIDYFLRTNDLNKQSDLDRGIFELGRCCASLKKPKAKTGFDTKWQVAAHLYYNQTSRSHFTRRATNLSSYLALCDQTLLNAIQSVISLTAPLFEPAQFDLDIPLIFGLFGMMTVQERRVGSMFQIIRSFNENGSLRILFPLLWIERNFFLDDGPRQRLEAEFEPGDPQAQEEFQNNHLISDKIGFGDLRIECDTSVACFGPSTVRLGAFVTLPTAFAFKKGLKGNHFSRTNPSCPPPFILDQLVCLSQGPFTDETKEKAFTLLQQFFLGSLDRLSAALLDTPLGNGRHVGIGVIARTSTPLSCFIPRVNAEQWSWHTLTSLEYLFQADERRFFIKRTNPCEFAIRDFENEGMATENLRFLDEQLVNKFYPLALRTSILPGIIVRWTNRLCYQGCHWDINLGTDMWIQNKEAFLEVNGCPTTLQTIDLRAAQLPFAYRYKLLGSVGYLKVGQCRDWRFGLSGEGTLVSSGIGKDFTFAFTVAAHF